MKYGISSDSNLALNRACVMDECLPFPEVESRSDYETLLFYAAAILLTLLSAALMMWASKLETWLPSRPAIALTLRFKPGFTPHQDTLVRVAKDRGYMVALGSLSARLIAGRQEWHYVAIDVSNGKAVCLSALAEELARFDGVEEFEITHARN